MSMGNRRNSSAGCHQSGLRARALLGSPHTLRDQKGHVRCAGGGGGRGRGGREARLGSHRALSVPGDCGLGAGFLLRLLSVGSSLFLHCLQHQAPSPPAVGEQEASIFKGGDSLLLMHTGPRCSDLGTVLSSVSSPGHTMLTAQARPTVTREGTRGLRTAKHPAHAACAGLSAPGPPSTSSKER